MCATKSQTTQAETRQNSWNPKKTTKSHFIEVAPGQNSVRIEEMFLEFIRNPKNSGMFNIFYNIWLEDLFEKSDMKMETWELKIAKS